MLVGQKIIDILNKVSPFLIHARSESLQKLEPVDLSLFIGESFDKNGQLNLLDKQTIFVDSLLEKMRLDETTYFSVDLCTGTVDGPEIGE